MRSEAGLEKEGQCYRSGDDSRRPEGNVPPSVAVVRLRGVPFPNTDYDAVLAVFSEWLRGVRTPRQVCTVNVHTFVTALRDERLSEVFRRAALLTMDGQPIRWYANLVHRAGVRETVAGPELMLRCLDKGRAFGWRHYLLGGRPEVLVALQKRAEALCPGVLIVGSEAPPFRSLTVEEESGIVERINAARADFLWVGLGAPKQEFWISRNLHRVRVPVQVGVGAAFDFHSGTIPRAPAWASRLGMEWMYRALHDRRLWHRYLSTNPAFVGMLLNDLVRSRLGRLRDDS